MVLKTALYSQFDFDVVPFTVFTPSLNVIHLNNPGIKDVLFAVRNCIAKLVVYSLPTGAVAINQVQCFSP